jgi:hypothetical protein
VELVKVLRYLFKPHCAGAKALSVVPVTRRRNPADWSSARPVAGTDVVWFCEHYEERSS